MARVLRPRSVENHHHPATRPPFLLFLLVSPLGLAVAAAREEGRRSARVIQCVKSTDGACWPPPLVPSTAVTMRIGTKGPAKRGGRKSSSFLFFALGKEKASKVAGEQSLPRQQLFSFPPPLWKYSVGLRATLTHKLRRGFGGQQAGGGGDFSPPPSSWANSPALLPWVYCSWGARKTEGSPSPS